MSVWRRSISSTRKTLARRGSWWLLEAGAAADMAAVDAVAAASAAAVAVAAMAVEVVVEAAAAVVAAALVAAAAAGAGVGAVAAACRGAVARSADPGRYMMETWMRTDRNSVRKRVPFAVWPNS
jgi:hypothetical protein